MHPEAPLGPGTLAPGLQGPGAQACSPWSAFHFPLHGTISHATPTDLGGPSICWAVLPDLVPPQCSLQSAWVLGGVDHTEGLVRDLWFSQWETERLLGLL